MTLSRRSFLAATAGTIIVGPTLLTSACSLSEPGNLTGKALESELDLPEPFTVPLPIPAVAQPVRSDATTDYYELVHRAARQEIIPGTTTEIWGYDGTFPGPTVVSTSGRRTVVRHRNELPVPTVVHLHGGHTPAASDGYPLDVILPVGSVASDSSDDETRVNPHGHVLTGGDVVVGERDYVYPLQQPAATLWYHDHRMDFTGPAVWRGLAGFHLVHDDEEAALALPTGERDIPLMICDRSFDADGNFAYPARDPSLLFEPGVTEDFVDGVLGDVILVNGAPWPVLKVSANRYRFRILNAANARRFELALDPSPEDAPFVAIGSDAGLLAAPVRHETLPIAQGERFDVVLDFSAYSVGTEITMTNRIGDGSTENVMRFRVSRAAQPDDQPVPERLADLSEFDALRESDATTTRTFDFAQDGERDGMAVWTVNGELFDPERMDARPHRGDVEIWELTSDPAHPFHLHALPFKVLSRSTNDDRPLPTDAGWKDTMDLIEGEKARILVRFDADPGTYVFHCHNLEHEDMAMMANVEIR